MGPSMNESVILSLYLLFTSVICYILYWYGYGRFQLFKQLGIPGPTPNLFVGNLFQVIKDYPDKLYMFVHDNLNKYGGVFGYYGPDSPIYVVSDPEMLKEIMVKKFSTFPSRFQPVTDRPYPLSFLLGRTWGEEWKFLRSALSPIFSDRKLRLLSTIFNKSSDTFINHLKEIHKAGKEFDINRLCKGFSMESMIGASFSLNAKSQTGANIKFATLLTEYLRGPPIWWILMKFLPLSKYFLRYVPNPAYRSMQIFLRDAIPIIRQRKEQKSEQWDMLQSMLDTQEKKESQSGRGMTEDEIFASCCSLIAGYEGFGASLSSMIYELAMHPEYQEMLHKEVCNIWTDTTVLPDFDLVKKMKYMDQIINESLRMYPVGAITLRTCIKDCTINGIRFCAGSTVLIPIYTLHRDSKAWEKPYEFYPDHFSQESISKRNEVMFIPFGYGPRMCIGFRFALLELKIVLARLVKEFKFIKTAKTPKQLEIVHRFAAVPKGDITLMVENR